MLSMPSGREARIGFGRAMSSGSAQLGRSSHTQACIQDVRKFLEGNCIRVPIAGCTQVCDVKSARWCTREVANAKWSRKLGWRMINIMSTFRMGPISDPASYAPNSSGDRPLPKLSGETMLLSMPSSKSSFSILPMGQQISRQVAGEEKRTAMQNAHSENGLSYDSTFVNVVYKSEQSESNLSIALNPVLQICGQCCSAVS
jgi:hypothetical protein